MSISYTYEIIAVDMPARCMEIIYRAEGRQTMHIGARLPYEGEAVESIVQMYAPVRYWEEQELAVVEVLVGTNGVIDPPIPVPVPVIESAPQPTTQGAQTL